jgi:transcriptional regulator with XRE-family HTH domain
MSADLDAARALAARLRGLRTTAWPHISIKQPMLATALGVSVPLVSSWENVRQPAVPPAERLEGYARFFSTARSLSGDRPRLLPDAELTIEEQAEMEQLRTELLAMRSDAVGTVVLQKATHTAPVRDSFWRFHDGAPVTIVCAPLPRDLQADDAYSDPNSPDYVHLYGYADPDALIELFGTIRAANPDSTVTYRLTPVAGRHLTTHLVLLGGFDWNELTPQVMRKLRVPISQRRREPDYVEGAFVTEANEVFSSVLRDDNGKRLLVEDVAHFVRGPNPFNRKRTVTICNGNYGRGTYAAVRALTDERFRDRNWEYLRSRFGDNEILSVLARVEIVAGEVVTPDWSLPGTVLHTWPEVAR